MRLANYVEEQAPEPTPAPTPVTAWKPSDAGNAEQFASWLAENVPVKYDHTRKRFYIYTGQYFAADDKSEIETLADRFISEWHFRAAKMIPEQAAIITGKLNFLYRRANKLNMIDEIKHLPNIASTADDFDERGWITFTNGVLEVATGRLHPHTHERLLTKYLDFDFDPQAKSEMWDTFQYELASGDTELMEAKQRLWGSVLAGAPDRAIIVAFGEKGTGKSAETEIISDTLGAFADIIDSEILLKKTAGATDRFPQEILRHKGKLLIVASETPENAKWHPGVKRISGGDKAAGRALHKEYDTTQPTFTLMLHTNYLPSADGDEAILERLKIMPYRYRFVDRADKIPLLEVKAKFATQEIKQAIFAWLYAGYKAYKNKSLDFKNLPLAMQNLIYEYQTEDDNFGNWLAENCLLTAGFWTSSRELYANYKGFCAMEGDTELTIKSFNKELSRRGFRSEIRAGNVKNFAGITIKPADQFSDF